METYHYLNTFDNTKITVDNMISYIFIMKITLSLFSHSPNYYMKSFIKHTILHYSAVLVMQLHQNNNVFVHVYILIVASTKVKIL